MKIFNNGDYLGRIYVGSQRVPCDVTLDTGSSALALNGDKYDLKNDKEAINTGLVQQASYGSGSWAGVVVKTNINIESQPSFELAGVDLAVTFRQSHMFGGKCDGILGLAYRVLDSGIYKVEKENGQIFFEPTNVTLEPYFTQLEKAGVVPNKFAFYTLRSIPNQVSPKLNEGYLILGGGENEKDLYIGEFQTAVVTHDEYYNVNLKSMNVDGQPVISIPPAANPDVPNCIVDSGTNGIVFPQGAYNALLNQFNGKFYTIIEQALSNGGYYPQDTLNLTEWPSITAVLEGVSGDITLKISPETYWQLDGGTGNASLRFFGSSTPAILGLPVMNNYYTIFDRSAGNGNGVIKFAAIKK
jgi:hypothetical protein